MCVCMKAKKQNKKKAKAPGIASEFRVMFNEVKKLFRSTEGLSKHIFYVSMCFQDSEMCKHNNRLFGNALQPCSHLQLKPVSSHMCIEVAHFLKVLFISYRSIFFYCVAVLILTASFDLDLLIVFSLKCHLVLVI